MRQRLAFALGLVVGAALPELARRAGRFRQRARAADPRADELRRKLAAARREAPAEPGGDPAEARPVDVEEERRRVYERGRDAVDEMRRAG